MAKVVVTKSKLDSLAQHINTKAGTTGAKTIAQMQATVDGISGGSAKETWIIKDNAPVDENSYELAKTNISFASAGAKFAAIQVDSDGVVIWLNYYTPVNKTINVGSFEPGMGEDRFNWPNSAYKKLTFDTPPTGALLSWLQTNATKQPSDVSVQDTKAVTITSNGTISVTPDAPYDALKKVDVTVDVASGGGGNAGFNVTFPATATNWDKLASGGIVQADGTVINMVDYSTLSGKTIPNVIAIRCVGDGYLVLRMTIQTGKFAVSHITLYGVNVWLATNNELTNTIMGDGSTMDWIPLADTVISAIEMYNTD